MWKRTRRSALVLAGVPSALMIALLWLYAGHAKPLTPQEVDRYIAEIGAQPQAPGGRHDLIALRSFLESDDGKPFYTVNLYRFHERARYLDDEFEQGTGREAFERFSQVMLRLLAQHASHPILGSSWAHGSSSQWDRIVVVRYRSRRDIAQIFATPEFAEASAHKWAALAGHGRMLVQGLHVPELHVPIFGLAIACGVIGYAVGHPRRGRVQPLP